MLLFYPAGNYICTGSRYIPFGVLFGPEEFPALLTSSVGSTCGWRQVSPPGFKVRFKLLYFDIPASEGCSENSLNIYNGLSETLMASLCGSLPEFVFEGSSNYMLVTLETSTRQAFRGFQGVFEPVRVAN